MKKFNRNYTCTIEIGLRKNLADFLPEETIEISYPTTMVFNISRNKLADANTGTFRFYNLSTEIQAKLWLDISQGSKYLKITVNAGYNSTIPRVFIGLATQCHTFREGGTTDFITEIQATDALFLLQYGFSNMTLSKGTKFKNMLNIMLEGVPDCEIGYVTDNIKELEANTTYCGQTMDLLDKEYSKYQIFVDNGQLHVLDRDEVVPGEIYVITSDSGLLGTPKRYDTSVEVDTIFEPGLVVGQAIQILSDSLSWLNETYIIDGITHSGIISPTIEGTLTTKVILSLGKKNLKYLTQDTTLYHQEDSIEGWTAPVSAVIKGQYGEPRSDHTHKGLDYGCPMNTPIKAAHDGVVSISGWVKGFGKAIYINHGVISGNKVESIYGHLNIINVAPNQLVKKGQIIGYSGNTGYSQGPHLHFQINENNRAVNPKKYIGGK